MFFSRFSVPSTFVRKTSSAASGDLSRWAARWITTSYSFTAAASAVFSTSSPELREKSSASKYRRTCVPKYPEPPVTRNFIRFACRPQTRGDRSQLRTFGDLNLNRPLLQAVLELRIHLFRNNNCEIP